MIKINTVNKQNADILKSIHGTAKLLPFTFYQNFWLPFPGFL